MLCWDGVQRRAQAQREAVEVLLHRRDLSPRVRERVEMVKAVALGYSPAGIARWTGRGERTIRRWLGQFVGRGLEALVDAPRAGRPPKVDVAYAAALEAALAVGPRACGLICDVWTTDRLSAYLAEQTGVRVAPGWLRTVLHRQGYSWGRAKHALRQRRIAAEVAACEAVLRAAGEKGGQRSGPLRAAP
jgi:transposase